MRCLVIDGDGCPDRKKIVTLGNAYQWDVQVFCDYNHHIDDDCKVVYIDQGRDSVDMAIIRCCGKGDIVISQDYGLAALALGKGAKVIHTSGKVIDNDNIDMFLMQRHINGVARKKGVRVHHSKRTQEDTDLLLSVLETNLKDKRNKDEI